MAEDTSHVPNLKRWPRRRSDLAAGLVLGIALVGADTSGGVVGTAALPEEVVVARQAGELVGAVAPEEGVVPVAPREAVVAPTAEDHVVAAPGR